MKRYSKTIAAVLPVVLLAACASDPVSQKLASLAFSYVRGENVKLPREQIAAIPYATMGLEFGFTPQILLVLGQANSDELDWYAGEELFVATQRGRVLRTAGLPNDLGGRHAVAQRGAGAVSYTLDFPDMGVFGVAALCASTNRGEESVQILGAAIVTRHVVEHCSVPGLKWVFDNEYWEDPTTGYVWRSRQYVHPKSPPIVLEVFRPEDATPG